MMRIKASVEGTEQVEKIGTAFSGKVVSVMENAAKIFAERMAEEGAPVQYPIQWDSERQKRVVIAKLAKEGNLPYKRTQRYVKGWRIMRLNDRRYEVINPVEYAAWVGGKANGWHSSIFAGRWHNIIEQMRTAMERAVNLFVGNGTS